MSCIISVPDDPSFGNNCKDICTNGIGDLMESCCNNCISYYGFPSSCCGLDAGLSSSSGGGRMEFTPAVVDSVVAVFNQGFQSGVLTFVYPVACALAILIVVHILTYAASKS